MNRYTAPSGTDAAHHRNHFPPSVREALAVLDRASEGQPIPQQDIDLALRMTGDVGWRRERFTPLPTTRAHAHFQEAA